MTEREVPSFMEKPTDRELEVLQLIANGFTNAKVAEALGVKEPTIKTHILHALGRLGAINRTHAVAITLRKGWINYPE